MSGFLEGEDRYQATLFPESLDEKFSHTLDPFPPVANLLTVAHMALILIGKSECPICRAPLVETDDLITTSAFIEDAHDPLWHYSDSGLHRSCFMSGPLRNDFVDSFNDYHEKHYRGMRRMLLNGDIEEVEPR